MQSASAKWNDDRLDDFKVDIDQQFQKLHHLFEHVDRQFEKVDLRFEHVDLRLGEIDRRFEQVDQRFEQVDQRFEQVDQRFEQVDQRFVSLEGEMRDGFKEVRAQIAQLNGNLLRMSLLYGTSILALFGAVLLRG